MTREIVNENENTREGAEQSRSREKRYTAQRISVDDENTIRACFAFTRHNHMNDETNSGVIKDKEKAII